MAVKHVKQLQYQSLKPYIRIPHGSVCGSWVGVQHYTTEAHANKLWVRFRSAGRETKSIPVATAACRVKELTCLQTYNEVIEFTTQLITSQIHRQQLMIVFYFFFSLCILP